MKGRLIPHGSGANIDLKKIVAQAITLREMPAGVQGFQASFWVIDDLFVQFSGRYPFIVAVKHSLIAESMRGLFQYLIAPFQNFLREYEQEYAEYYLRARENNGIVARSLWERGMKGRRLTKKEIRLRNPRFMPKSMENRFRSLIIIFDDKVAIISPLEGLSAALITSREISSMFRALFDGIWEVSEKYR